MTPKSATELRAAAEKLVAAVEHHETVSPADRATIVDAMAVDLGTADDHGVITEDRLVKLEAQSQVLTDAVIAITEAAAAVAPAAKALTKTRYD
jgi:hypothetical protein